MVKMFWCFLGVSSALLVNFTDAHNSSISLGSILKCSLPPLLNQMGSDICPLGNQLSSSCSRQAYRSPAMHGLVLTGAQAHCRHPAILHYMDYKGQQSMPHTITKINSRWIEDRSCLSKITSDFLSFVRSESLVH